MKESKTKYNSIDSYRPEKTRGIVSYNPYPSKEQQEEYERMWKQLCDSSRRRMRREQL